VVVVARVVLITGAAGRLIGTGKVDAGMLVLTGLYIQY